MVFFVIRKINNIIPVICDICEEVNNIKKYYMFINKLKKVLVSGRRGESELCSRLLKAINEEKGRISF